MCAEGASHLPLDAHLPRPLLDATRKGTLRLVVVPEIVIREAGNNWTERTRAGADIAPLPAIETDALVHRALSRYQPFDSNGQNGYRDTVSLRDRRCPRG